MRFSSSLAPVGFPFSKDPSSTGSNRFFPLQRCFWKPNAEQALPQAPRSPQPLLPAETSGRVPASAFASAWPSGSARRHQTSFATSHTRARLGAAPGSQGGLIPGSFPGCPSRSPCAPANISPSGSTSTSGVTSPATHPQQFPRDNTNRPGEGWERSEGGGTRPASATRHMAVAMENGVSRGATNQGIKDMPFPAPQGAALPCVSRFSQSSDLASPLGRKPPF